MFAPQRRGRGFDLGVLLLVSQLFLQNQYIPPVTLWTILTQLAIFLGFIPALTFQNIHSVCLSPIQILRHWEWQRIIFSPFVHADDMHLYYNMVSFLWKGRRLEQRFGAKYFAFLLAVFSVLTSLVMIGVSVTLEEVLNFRDLHLMGQCAVGFSGVIFALKVLSTEYFPTADSMIFGLFPIPSRYVCWAELALIQILVPNASFIGHLSGILVGLLYTKGPLKMIMDRIVADPYLTPQNRRQQRQRDPQQSDDYYYQQPGPSGAYRPRFYGGGSWGSPQADHTPEYDHFTGGLSEEEQMRRAMEQSVHEFRFRNGGGGGGGLYPNVY